MTRGKAAQSTVPNPATGYRGFGWAQHDAAGLVTDLIGGLIGRSAGGTLGDTFPDGNPPLDHEDGMVYGACKQLAAEDPLSNVYCVTNDQGFLSAHKQGELRGHSRVITPSTFLLLVRAARAQYGSPKQRLLP